VYSVFSVAYFNRSLDYPRDGVCPATARSAVTSVICGCNSIIGERKTFKEGREAFFIFFLVFRLEAGTIILLFSFAQMSKSSVR
jgi:hypothetical protein